MQDRELWERINDYYFPVGFKEKLSQQFEGKKSTAEALCEEYRRFVYLAVISPNEVTPSEQVDHVWHLHLSYTRSYWNEFCADVLREDLHHDPSNGPESAPKYQAQYDATLALYQREFDIIPNSKAWPSETSIRWARLGLLVAAIGVVIGVWAFSTGDKGLTLRTSIALLFLVGGIVYVSSSAPYRHYSKSSGSSFGGGGGCGGGCGGGG